MQGWVLVTGSKPVNYVLMKKKDTLRGINPPGEQQACGDNCQIRDSILNEEWKRSLLTGSGSEVNADTPKDRYSI